MNVNTSKPDEGGSERDLEPKPAPASEPAVLRANVPVFNCIVYVSKVDEGVRARVANLAAICASAESEREALGKVITAFKRAVGQFYQDGAPIPWIDPPIAAESFEKPRYIPVHL